MTSPTDPFTTTGDEELARLLRGYQRELAEIEDLRDRIASVEGRGEAAGGRVVVNVTQTGALAGVTIDPRAMRLGSEQLAEAIMEAASAATRDAEREARDTVAPFISGTTLDDRRDGTRGR